MLTKKEDFMSNKELVLKFYDEVFNGWNVDAIKIIFTKIMSNIILL